MSSDNFKIQPTSVTLDAIPPGSLLVHSTNCLGTWGAGVALAIRGLYPSADVVYKAHCDALRPSPGQWPRREEIVGTCLLIPPQPNDKTRVGVERGVWIACIFTSYGYGRTTNRKPGKDSKVKIIQQTKEALGDLKRQLALMSKEEGSNYQGPKDVYSPQFNAGSFGVKWEETVPIVEDIFQTWPDKWFVLRPPGE